MEEKNVHTHTGKPYDEHEIKEKDLHIEDSDFMSNLFSFRTVLVFAVIVGLLLILNLR